MVVQLAKLETNGLSYIFRITSAGIPNGLFQASKIRHKAIGSSGYILEILLRLRGGVPIQASRYIGISMPETGIIVYLAKGFGTL